MSVKKAVVIGISSQNYVVCRLFMLIFFPNFFLWYVLRFCAEPKKFYFFPEIVEVDVEPRKHSELQSFLKTLCSVHKMIACTQHQDYSFPSKIAFCLFRDKKLSTKLWYNIFASTLSQLINFLKNLRTCIVFLRDNIFKSDIRTTLSNLLSWKKMAGLTFPPKMRYEKGASANLRMIAHYGWKYGRS